jgi:hypothetical protein
VRQRRQHGPPLFRVDHAAGAGQRIFLPSRRQSPAGDRGVRFRSGGGAPQRCRALSGAEVVDPNRVGKISRNTST